MRATLGGVFCAEPWFAQQPGHRSTHLFVVILQAIGPAGIHIGANHVQHVARSLCRQHRVKAELFAKGHRQWRDDAVHCNDHHT